MFFKKMFDFDTSSHLTFPRNTGLQSILLVLITALQRKIPELHTYANIAISINWSICNIYLSLELKMSCTSCPPNITLVSSLTIILCFGKCPRKVVENISQEYI